MEVIDNGVEQSSRSVEHHRCVCIALGRICVEKGFDVALRAAHQARQPMLLAGTSFRIRNTSLTSNVTFNPCWIPGVDSLVRLMRRDDAGYLLEHRAC